MALTKVSRGLLSTGIVDNSTTTAITIDSSENVGIGTSSPSSSAGWGTLLEVSGTTNAGIKLTETDTANGDFSLGVTAGTFRIWDETASAFRLTLDGSGNVGIGTSSPATQLFVKSASNAANVFSIESADALQRLQFGVNTSNGGSYLFEQKAQALRFGTSDTERMRIDSSGRVGIGTSTPTQELEIKAASVPTLKFNQAGTYGAEIALRGNDLDIAGSANAIVFYTGGNNDVSTTERMRIDSSGNVMVGTTTQYFARLSVQGEANQNAVTVRVGTNGYPAINFQNTAGAQQGYITTNASSVQYISISDQRAKENIADADDAGSKIDSIQVRKFDWIADGSHQDYGMIAQELQAVAPEAVSGDPNSENMMGVDYSKLVPMLVKEIQSLRTRVQELENN